MVRIEAVDLIRVRMPLVAPFRTSFGTQTDRDVLLLRVRTPDADGWGECTAPTEPVFSHEYTEAAAHVTEHHLLPRLFAHRVGSAAEVASALRGVRGWPMAKAAVEGAVLDAELRAAGRSLADWLGVTRRRVPCGVSVGIPEGGIPALLDTVEAYLAAGYRRIKLKIEPGFDLEPVRAVRDRWPQVPLQVDANAAYDPADADRLVALDDLDLLLIEQPFAPDRLLDHARLAARLRTPVCLDETITSAAVCADALDLDACRVVNIKVGRVGGIFEAVRIHDLCRARGVPVWCGGMLETGIGRAVNVAVAALPGFSLPGDTSASDRYWRQDLTRPFVLEDGELAVPDGPGIGVEPLPEVLAELTISTRTVRPEQ